MGQQSDAQTALQRVIDSGEYELVDNYGDLWGPENENNIESIFEVQYTAGTGNEGSGYTNFFSPSSDLQTGEGVGRTPAEEDLPQHVLEDGPLVDVLGQGREPLDVVDGLARFTQFCGVRDVGRSLDFGPEQHEIARVRDVAFVAVQQAFHPVGPGEVVVHGYRSKTRSSSSRSDASSEESSIASGSTGAFSRTLIVVRSIAAVT